MSFYRRWKAFPSRSERNDFFGDRFDPSKDELYLKYSVQSLAMEQREYWDNETPDDGTTTAEWEEIIREYVTFRVYEGLQDVACKMLDAALEQHKDSEEDLKYHQCKRGDSWEEYDAQGIYLCRVCDKCQEAKLAQYRPEILRGYTQDDVEEPIEEQS